VIRGWLALVVLWGCGHAPPRPVEHDLAGLWGSDQTFATARGPILVTARTGGWSATFGAIHGELAPLADGWWQVALGDNALRIRPRARDPEHLDAFWLQASGTMLERAYASPLVLARTPAGYAGDVEPLDDRLQLYLMIERSGAAWIREPRVNAGAITGDLQLIRRGDELELLRADGKRGLHGRIERRADGLHLALVFDGPDLALDLTRRGRDDAPGFYPRPRDALQFQARVPTARDDGWPVASLADVDLREAPIAALVQRVIDATPTGWRSPAVHALLVARHGKLVVEEYFAGFTADTLHDLRSAGKSWTSALAGVAVGRGDLAATSRLVDVVPAAASTDPRRAAITLEHLLTMSSGIDCDDDNGDHPGNENVMQNQRGERDWYRYMLALPMMHAPGERAEYCSGTINLVGAMLEPALGWIPAAWHDGLARPLQITRFAMNLMPTEQGYLGGGVHLRARDFAKLPQLYLNGGSWSGASILRPAWVTRSIEPRVSIHAPRDYGYAWWQITYRVDGVDYPAFFASGNGGQLAIAIPSLDLVVAVMAGNYNSFKTWRAFYEDWVPRYLIPAARP
jgi:CubicO group peptidase (beta-lactamase class C family)